MNSGEDSAFPMVSSSSSASCNYEGIKSLDCSMRKISVVEIVKDVGLITCERRVIGQRARLFIWRSASGILPR